MGGCRQRALARTVEVSRPRARRARDRGTHDRATWLEVADAAGGNEAEQEGQHDGSDDGDEDGVEEASGAGVAEGDHDEAADNGSDDADDDVDEWAEAGAAHDLAGEKAREETDDQPNEERVRAFGGLDVMADIDVMDVRSHGRFSCGGLCAWESECRGAGGVAWVRGLFRR